MSLSVYLGCRRVNDDNDASTIASPVPSLRFCLRSTNVLTVAGSTVLGEVSFTVFPELLLVCVCVK